MLSYYPKMQKPFAKMLDLHIMLPNECVYRNFPKNGNKSNASFVAPLSKQSNRIDDTAYKTFKLTDKYRTLHLLEPPVLSLVIYNSKKATGNDYTCNPNTNGV